MAVDEDDSFHHNHFAWGNARTRIKDYWSHELQRALDRLEIRSHGPADGLLQLPEKMPQRDQVAGTAALRLQVLRQGHLSHGGVSGARFQLRDSRRRPGIRRRLLLDAAGDRLRARIARSRHLERPATSRACRPTARAGSSICWKRSCAAKASATCWPTASGMRRAGSATAPRNSSTTPPRNSSSCRSSSAG